MRIGIVTDSLAHLPFEAMLDTVAQLGIEGIELNTSNWSTAPHCDLPGLLASGDARKALLGAIADRELELFALNANGSQLHPTDGERQSRTACSFGLDQHKTMLSVVLTRRPTGRQRLRAVVEKMDEWSLFP